MSLRLLDRDPRKHAIGCSCADCDEFAVRLTQTRVVHDAPTGALPPQSVSLRELVSNAPVTPQKFHYEIGEDWSDD